MRLLVLGSNGLVGSNALARALARGWQVAGTYRSAAPDVDIPLSRHDVRETGEFERLVERHEPDAVVNCAAATDVDGCETHPERAHEVNAEAPGAVAAACHERDLEFVHCSTDYVFDGETDTPDTPYSEMATPNPVQVYGASKLRGERAVRATHEGALIVRFSFVYGCHGVTGELAGFPAWVRDRLAAGRTVPLFTDQHVTPTRAGSAAGTILDLLDDGTAGTYHVASRSCVTPYSFAETIRPHLADTTDATGADTPASSFEETTLSAVDRPARRPRHTCLDVDRVERALGRAQPTLAADVAAIADAFTG